MPGVIVVILMLITFVGGYGIGRFIVRPWIHRTLPNNNNTWLSIGVGVLAVGLSVAGLVCGFFSFWMYEVGRIPSPSPYPNATVTQDWDNYRVSASHSADIFEYTVEQPLDKMEQYYRNEMQRYCAPGWEFNDTNLLCSTDGYSTCRTARCEIVKPLTKDTQFFEVYLRSTSSDQTNVIYFEIFRNLK